ncbi:MAG: response regulator [Chloroflexota bacterium]
MTRILLLDDNAEMVTMLRLVLEQRGHEVVWGRHGEDGMRMLQQSSRKPDLIISNLLMPTMDGMAFLDKVRGNPEWSSIPFVMMSQVSSDERKRATFEHGADAFLAKPFRFEDLNKTLNNLGVGRVRA